MEILSHLLRKYSFANTLLSDEIQENAFVRVILCVFVCVLWMLVARTWILDAQILIF